MSCDEDFVEVDCDTPVVWADCEEETIVVVSCERGPAGPAGPPGTIDPWDVATSYPADAVVSYDGNLYVSLRSTVGDQPDVSPSDWQLQGSAVDSVNGQTGVVLIDAADVPYDYVYAQSQTSGFFGPAQDDVQAFGDRLIDAFVYLSGQVTTVGDRISRSINKTGHGLSVGQVVHLSGGSESGAGTYVLSQANNETNAQVDGMVLAVTDANNFVLLMSGYISSGLSGFTASSLYYLSPTVPGALTLTKPTVPGQVVKPLFRTIGSTRGQFTIENSSYVVPEVSEDDFIALAVAL